MPTSSLRKSKGTDVPETDGWLDGTNLSHDKSILGRQAEALLSDPLLKHVFESVKTKYRLSWENAPRGDHERQQIAHLSLAALKDVEGTLRAYLHSAKIIAAEKDREKQAALHPDIIGY